MLEIGKSYKLKATGSEVVFIGTLSGFPTFRRLDNGTDVSIDKASIAREVETVETTLQMPLDFPTASPDEQAAKLIAQRQTAQTSVQAPLVSAELPVVSAEVLPDQMSAEEAVTKQQDATSELPKAKTKRV